MFRFAVRHLYFLAHIPGVPHFFDAMLLAWTAAFHRPRLHAMDALEVVARRMPGVERRAHRFGGTGFVCHGREFAHLHGNGLLDVHLNLEVAAEMVAAGMAKPHHVFGPSTWVSFQVHGEADLPHAMRLLEEGRRLAMLAATAAAPGRRSGDANHHA